MKKPVAIFDIDGTVFRSSLLIELVEALVQRGVFPESARKNYADAYNKWLNREGDYQDYINAVISSFEEYLKGTHYAEFKKASDFVVYEHQNKVYRYTRDLLRDLKRKGYFLLAISQSPKVVVEDFAKKLGFNKVYGRIYEIDSSSKFTGTVSDLHVIANKSNIVRRAVKKENLTLEKSFGVGDTDGDISFLELVDNPICFNPNDKLYRYARLMDWSVVVERKNVIYNI